MNQDKWTFYVDRNKKWRWSRTSLSTGKITAVSTEGFPSKASCIANAKKNGFYRN